MPLLHLTYLPLPKCPSGRFNSWASRASSCTTCLLASVTLNAATEWGRGFLACGTKSDCVGCAMKSYKAFPFLILVACVFLGSCSGLPQGTGGGGGTANVSLVMISDTPPATLGLVSFKVTPT